MTGGRTIFVTSSIGILLVGREMKNMVVTLIGILYGGREENSDYLGWWLLFSLVSFVVTGERTILLSSIRILVRGERTNHFGLGSLIFPRQYVASCYVRR